MLAAAASVYSGYTLGSTGIGMLSFWLNPNFSACVLIVCGSS